MTYDLIMTGQCKIFGLDNKSLSVEKIIVHDNKIQIKFYSVSVIKFCYTMLELDGYWKEE